MVASNLGVAPDPTAALRAPRPITPNENIFQYQNSGHLLGNLVSFNLDQHDYKLLGLSFRYAHMNFKSNVVDGGINSPQSTYSEMGESGRVEWSKNNYCSLTGNLVLPDKVELATQLDAGDGRRYSLTTGTDEHDVALYGRINFLQRGTCGTFRVTPQNDHTCKLLRIAARSACGNVFNG
jgi:hypothetical protein